MRRAGSVNFCRHGRHSTFSMEMAQRICDAVSTSTQGLKHICASDEAFPSRPTVMRWLNRYPEFRDIYAQAKEAQMELLAEEIMEIADTHDDEVEIIEAKDGTKRIRVNNEAVQRAKLRVDTRKWLMSKLSPRKFGDRIDVTSGGEKLPANAQHIDQRVQSIVMQAAQRLAQSKELEGWDALSPEARALLE